MPESQSAYLTRLLRRMCLAAAILSWALLLGYVLWRTQAQAQGQPPRWEYLSHVLGTVFLLSVFVYQRTSYPVVRSSEFIQFLLKVLVRSGVLALGSLTLFVAYVVATRFYLGPNAYLLNLVYLVFFAAMTVFFAKVFITW